MPRKKISKKTENQSGVVEGSTGTYVFDKKLGKVVKLSDSIPKVASHASKGSPEITTPCGRTSCPSGGPCPEL